LPTDRLDYSPGAGRRRLAPPREAHTVVWIIVNANERLERTGEEGRAIREANAVIARQAEDTY
jgi:hypothetical protein